MRARCLNVSPHHLGEGPHHQGSKRLCECGLQRHVRLISSKIGRDGRDSCSIPGHYPQYGNSHLSNILYPLGDNHNILYTQPNCFHLYAPQPLTRYRRAFYHQQQPGRSCGPQMVVPVPKGTEEQGGNGSCGDCESWSSPKGLAARWSDGSHHRKHFRQVSGVQVGGARVS